MISEKSPEIRPVFEKQEVIICNGCYNYTNTEDVILLGSNQHLCKKCSTGEFRCGICLSIENGEYFYYINLQTKGHICLNCEGKKGSSSINQYSYKPSPLFFANDYLSKNTYFGIELEVESGGVDISDVTFIFRDKRLYFKFDGSLQDGFEIVSHPMTFEYIKSNREFFEKLLKGLEHNKCKSANTNTCGMHIHISKNNISSIQLWKMLDFFRKNKKFIYMMSGRTSTRQINRYASLGKISKNTQPYMAKKYWDNADKYTAINILPHNTIEFRIFKGTLNPKKFFKNIEFVESLIQWTNIESLKRITIANYCQYVKKNKNKYLNVIRFMEDNHMIKEKINRTKKPIEINL